LLFGSASSLTTISILICLKALVIVPLIPLIEIPDGVKVDIKSRTVTISGIRGTTTKAFKHIKIEILIREEADPNNKNKKKRFIELNTYMNTYKNSAILYTIGSHIKNMITGVTKGFRYKMHLVKKHFPINFDIEGDCVKIGRFLGERNVKVIKLLEGVKASKNDKNQEEIYFDGNDIEKVSLTCALIYQSCKIKDKDGRKFLDGIYVNEKTHVEK